MKKFFLIILFFLYGCGGEMANKIDLKTEKIFVWRNMMPSLKKEREPFVNIKVYIKPAKKDITFFVKEAKIIFDESICESKDTDIVKEADKRVVTIRGCKVPFEIDKLKIKLILEDGNGNSYTIKSQEIKIGKIY